MTLYKPVSRSIFLFTCLIFMKIGLFAHGHTPPSTVGNTPFLLDFIENNGQWIVDARYKADVPGGAMFLTDEGFVYHYVSSEDLSRLHETGYQQEGNPSGAMVRHHAYRVRYLNARQGVRYAAGDKRTYYHNYILGNDPATWKGRVGLYGTVLQEGVYKGIDVSVYSNETTLKYDFIVAPGADPGQIRLSFEGVLPVLTEEGHLKISTTVNEVIEEAPYVYQEIGGMRVQVPCRYHLQDNVLSFELPEGYDRHYPLIIDPSVVFSTFSGSTGGSKYGYSSAYDQDGNFYLGALALSTGWPVTTGAFQTTYGGSNDVAINKYNSTGSTLLWSTYYGGNNVDIPHSLIVNEQNELIVVGTTASSNLPVSANGYDRTLGGANDLFVVHFNTAGSALVGATYIGGTAGEGIHQTAGVGNATFEQGVFFVSPCDVVLDDNGDIWVISNTASSNFPVTPGAQQTTYGGGQTDVVLFRLKSDCTALLYSTFLGGSRKDDGHGIVRNHQNQIVICGGTNSPNFPVSFGAYKSGPTGSADGFVSIVNPATGLITRSTYLGTDTLDIAFKVAVNAQGYVYVAGRTMGNYPVSAGVISMGTDKDLFLEKLTPDLGASVVSTRFGNQQSLSTRFVPTALTVDECNNVYLTGFRWTSGLAGYPLTANAFQSSSGRFWLGVLETDFTGIHFGTFYGGGGSNYHIHQGTHRLDPHGMVYHSICVDNSSFPVTTGSYRTSKNNTDQDAASFKFDLSEYVQQDTVYVRYDTAVCYGSGVSLTAGAGLATTDHLWQDGSTGKTFRANASGTYIVRYRYADQPCTFYYDSFYVAFAPLPELLAVHVDSAGCPGELKGVVDIQVSGNQTQCQFDLHQATDSSLSQSGTSAAGFRFAGLDAGDYYVVITTASGCDTAFVLTVPGAVAPAASFTVSDSIICVGESVDCFNTSSGAYDIWYWDPGNGAELSQVYQPRFYYPVAGRHAISLGIENDQCADTAVQYIEVKDFSLRLLTSADIVKYGEEVRLWTDADEPYTVYQWSPEPMFPNQQAYEQTVIPDSNSINTITVYGRSEYGCPDSASLIVIVDGGLGPVGDSSGLATMPTAFSPNGDGRNDYFRPAVLSGKLRVAFFEVYDRWGKQVWSASGAAALKGWDGTYNGTPAGVGAYYYTAEMEDLRGQRFRYRGDVTLVR